MAERRKDKRVAEIYTNRSRKTLSETRSRKPKFEELGVLKRNQKWLEARQRKITAERKEKKAHETDGCTFQPKINKSKPKLNRSRYTSRSNISTGSKTNRSYSDIHRNKYSRRNSFNNSLSTLNKEDTIITEQSKTSQISNSRAIRAKYHSSTNTMS